MQTLRSIVRAYLRGGVPLGMSSRGARTVELINLAAFIGTMAIVVFLPTTLLLESMAVFVVTAAQLPPLVFAMWLNRRGHHFRATLTLAIAGFCAWTLQPIFFGSDGGHHAFLLVLAASVPLLLPIEKRTLVVVVLITGLVAFVGLSTWGDRITPVFPLNQGVIAWTRGALAAGVFILIAGIGLYAATATARAEDEADREHKKSEALLRSILPMAIAERLKERPGEAIAERVDAVTVLFADMVGFTDACANVAPDVVVERLNTIFRTFDALAAELGLEKIKTIGDAYMAAAGVPVPVVDHAERAAHMAMRMMERAHSMQGIDGRPLRLRIGLHTGPVVVGVIGSEKPAYDLWGDTVNIASRMESSGVPGRIQMTRAVQACLPTHFRHEDRGSIDVKGKGAMDVAFLLHDDQS
jgi:adenylate cyclase